MRHRFTSSDRLWILGTFMFLLVFVFRVFNHFFFLCILRSIYFYDCIHLKSTQLDGPNEYTDRGKRLRSINWSIVLCLVIFVFRYFFFSLCFLICSLFFFIHFNFNELSNSFASFYLFFEIIHIITQKSIESIHIIDAYKKWEMRKRFNRLSHRKQFDFVIHVEFHDYFFVSLIFFCLLENVTEDPNSNSCLHERWREKNGVENDWTEGCSGRKSWVQLSMSF